LHLNTKVEGIILGINNITKDGAEYLGEALQNNAYLKYLLLCIFATDNN
jgi:hypothetical protein